MRSNAGLFGHTDKALFGAELPILAMIGDQQAAAVGQAWCEPGALKSTFGTELFHDREYRRRLAVTSKNRLLTTVGCGWTARPAMRWKGLFLLPVR